MATFEITTKTITVHPHPNAERLELAQVGLYNVVVPKGVYNTGDIVLYIPAQAILPPDLITKLNLDGKLSGKDKNRVKEIRLRGSLSEGLVAPTSILPVGTKLEPNTNYVNVLNVIKWEPEVPTTMDGVAKGNSEIVGWAKIENIKMFPDMFIEGEKVHVTEKIHGTCSCYTFINPLTENIPIVSSNGLNAKKFELLEDDTNLYWNMLKTYGLAGFAKNVAEELRIDTVAKIALFGETYGKVQDLKYGEINETKFALFDIRAIGTKDSEKYDEWLNPELVEKLAIKYGIPTVPHLYTGPYNFKTITTLGEGKEQVSGTESNIKEGVIIRPINREGDRYEGRTRIAKYVTDAYLLRKNATEYK